MNAGINLNPYQGLKQGIRDLGASRKCRAGINLNPYQGLKLVKCLSNRYREGNKAGINLNPYQGLKQGGYL